MRTALVTGGAGFIGRHVVKSLLEKDYFVHIVDDLSNGIKPEEHKDIKFHWASCLDYFEYFRSIK